jgi:hypothetical protein
MGIHSGYPVMCTHTAIKRRPDRGRNAETTLSLRQCAHSLPTQNLHGPGSRHDTKHGKHGWQGPCTGSGTVVYSYLDLGNLAAHQVPPRPGLPDPRNVSFGLRNVSFGLRNVSFGLRNVSWRLRNVSWRLRNVSLRLRNVGLRLRNLSLKLRNLSLRLRNVT